MASRLVTENGLLCQTNNVWSVKESENLTGALNRALSLADGDYMMFLGQYHRRYLGEKGTGEITRENTAGKNSLTAALRRRGIAARVEDGESSGSYHIMGN